MENPLGRRWFLIGLASGILVALFVIPATRHIVRTQIALVLPIRPPVAALAYLDGNRGVSDGQLEALNRAAEDYANAHPADFQLHLGVALRMFTKPADKVARLRALEARFPDNPSLYANLLRFEAQSYLINCR